MTKLNWLFYKVWAPLTLLTLYLLTTQSINWWLVLVGWIILGPIATGVGLHRLLAHRAFATHHYVEKILAYLGTLSAWAPILFWVAEHQYHHRHSDTEKDPTNPRVKGFWYSFFYWRFLKEALDKIDLLNSYSKRIIRDKKLMWLNDNFTKIIWAHVIILAIISPALLLSLYLLPILIESTRSGLLNSLSHIDRMPFSYRNYETNDRSYNNLIFGYLSLGFGWHNNHHYNPGKNIIHDRWWEIDIEGYIGYVLSKIKFKDK
jgi:fatty-acid desaturase